MHERKLVVNITGQPGVGKSSTVHELVKDGNSLIGHLSVSGLIRTFAKAQGLTAATRHDMREAHAAMMADNEFAVTDEVFKLSFAHDLVLVDGLRVYDHAKYLKDAFGDSYRTATLTAPDELRYHRVFMRSVMNEQLPPTFEAFIADNESGLYRFQDVMAMHDLSSEPIDTSRFSSPHETAAHLAQLIRPHILL